MNSELYDLLESTGAFQNPLNSLSSGATNLASAGTSGLNSISSTSDLQVKAALTAGGLTPAKLNAGTAAMASATTGVGTLVTYGDRTVSEAFSRINTTTAYTNGLTNIGRAPTTCDTINSAFSVIQQKGAEWLKAMENALTYVTGKIAELQELVEKGISAGIALITQIAAEVQAAIDSAISAISKVVNDIVAGIAAELAELEKMVKSCINFCMTSMFPDWMKDGCVAGAIQKMATPSLKALV